MDTDNMRKAMLAGVAYDTAHALASSTPSEPQAPPVLTSLSPNTVVSGDPDFPLSCLGSGFTAETTIRFGDYDEPTTLVSETEVTTIVKPSLFAPATVPVMVHNGTANSDPLDFTFTAASGRTRARR
ncbi:IPT/TIG domain-containing protein [Bradyrhizobium septentrionale]|uniref:IPT/TIG domain-containing protein n=1 Tax=Bradyrhizobium septentrionale TaxID=1404411 RepID=A0A973W0H4_9BRAD|nr:IPT/TIG domain-containing protein [Bradyrhizobium septentrionale]UGY13767.1 IPT/TIG domain-containing protein [Bradyrhizobium septentrionale]